MRATDPDNGFDDVVTYSILGGTSAGTGVHTPCCPHHALAAHGSPRHRHGLLHPAEPQRQQGQRRRERRRPPYGSHDDGDDSGQPHFGSSSVWVFSRSIGCGPRSGTASNRSSVHFADEKLPRLIQASSKEEVMRARNSSWDTPSAALATERHKHKSRQQVTAEKATIFDQNSSKSLTLQPSSYYLNEMRKYRESGQLPVDTTRYSINPYVVAVVVTLATE